MRAPTLAIALCAAGAQAFVGVPVVQQPITSAATTRGRSSVQPVSSYVLRVRFVHTVAS